MDKTSSASPASAGNSAYDILDELPVAYLELNAEGVVIRANRAARAFNPHQDGDLIGRISWNIMATDQKEWSRAAFFKVMESGENPPPIRRSLYTRGGEFRTFELHRSLIRDAHGKPAGIRMISFDITEAQIENENAHKAKVWMESILESVSEAVVVTDALGYVSYVNPAAEALTGWTAKELTGKLFEKEFPLLSYTSHDRNPLTPRMVLDRRCKGTATTLNHDRRELRVEIATSPILDKENGITIGVVSVLRKVDSAEV